MVSQKYDVERSKNIAEKISALRNLSKSFEMKMEGFKLDTGNDKWIPNGQNGVRLPLATSNVINQAVGIISSFTEDVNLLTTKKAEKFLMEFTDAFFKFNGIVLNDIGTPQENHRVVIKMFKDTMSNIGDIIIGSKAIFGKIYENQNLLDGDREAVY